MFFFSFYLLQQKFISKWSGLSEAKPKSTKYPEFTQNNGILRKNLRNHELIAEPFHEIRDRCMAVSCDKINEISMSYWL